MGLFESIGERIEQLKKDTIEASREGAAWECRACGEYLYLSRETCPACGSDAIAEREPDRREASRDTGSVDRERTVNHRGNRKDHGRARDSGTSRESGDEEWEWVSMSDAKSPHETHQHEDGNDWRS